MQLWRCSCLPKVCLAKLRKSRLLLKVIFVCCRGPIFASLIYLYPAPVVDVEPILQGKIYPSTFGRPLTVALELRSLDASIRDNLSSVAESKVLQPFAGLLFLTPP